MDLQPSGVGRTCESHQSTYIIAQHQREVNEDFDNMEQLRKTILFKTTAHSERKPSDSSELVASACHPQNKQNKFASTTQQIQ